MTLILGTDEALRGGDARHQGADERHQEDAADERSALNFLAPHAYEVVASLRGGDDPKTAKVHQKKSTVSCTADRSGRAL